MSLQPHLLEALHEYPELDYSAPNRTVGRTVWFIVPSLDDSAEEE
ncbi:hypothetical protein ACIQU1_22420 [Streptomyces angustmyceticus]